jgi:hypothetical protein
MNQKKVFEEEFSGDGLTITDQALTIIQKREKAKNNLTFAK